MPYKSAHDAGDHPSFYRLREHSSKRSWWRILLIVLAVFFLLGGAGIGGGYYYFARDLPSIDVLRSYEPSQATRVYSDDNRLIGQFFIEKRVFVPLVRLPEILPQAIIAVEDSRFYKHKGFSIEAMARAFIANLSSLRIRQGASTITQQLTRSLFLSPERTMTRKIKELLLAYRMEQLLSKEEILEFYLNQIYFGHGAYGIQVASRTYFGKDASELELPEAAMLAGLPKAPSVYSPFNNPEKAKVRQRVVLKRMVVEGYITGEEYKEAYAKNIYLQKPLRGKDLAPHFVEQVRQYLVSTYGSDTVYRGGLNVYTTLNIEMQKSANQAVREGLRKLDKRQGYRGPHGRRSEQEEKTGRVARHLGVGEIVDGEVTVLDTNEVWVNVGIAEGKIPLEEMSWAFRRFKGQNSEDEVRTLKNGKPSDILSVGDLVKVRVKQLSPGGIPKILSLEQEPEVEGAFIALDTHSGAIKAMVGGYDFKKSEFNRAVRAHRQPGSVFKPIIYATAVEMGFSPSSMVVDSPIIYVDPETEKVWKPENYEGRFYGPVRLRDALAYSRNLATVHLLQKIGVRNVIRFAHRVGIQSPLSPDLSLALGSSGVGLLELSSAISVFPNQGVRCEPVMITSITDSTGIVLESNVCQEQRVISRETAYIVTNMLEDVVQRGTARRAKKLGRSLAGKTGTTNDYTDAWFIGYAPNLLAGVWVGYNDLRSLGNKEAGGAVALPIWINFMAETLPGLPERTFPIPEGIIYVKIDPKTGLLAPKGTKDTVVDIFVRGTEPTRVSVPVPQAIEFFKADQLGY